jgi:hypothetical protein
MVKDGKNIYTKVLDSIKYSDEFFSIVTIENALY